MNFASYRRNQIIIGAVAAVIIGVVAAMWFCFLPGFSRCRAENTVPKTELEFWNVFEDSDVYQPLIAKFRDKYPNISIAYKKKEVDTYPSALTEALTQGIGPDIFAIHNTWLPVQQKRISPMPANLLSFNAFREMFPDVVRFDFSREKGLPVPQVYALPLFVDTLALFYNKAYFNSANIVEPPATWEDFLRYTKELTKKSAVGEIDLAGAAIGTAENINRSTDILGLLMLQSGARMTNDEQTAATFAESVYSNGTRFDPGLQALAFYTSFADRTKEAYSWHGGMPYSIDAFVQGDAAMMFNYSYAIPTLERKNKYLDFAVASAPQPKDQREKISYANYWGLTVSKNSKNPEAAWQFILFLLEDENAKSYLSKVQRPTSLRALIPWQEQTASEKLKPFVGQVLTARSWHEGDSLRAEQIFADAIEQVATGSKSAQDALKEAETKVSAVIQTVARGLAP